MGERIPIASDHAGFEMKEKIKAKLVDLKHNVLSFYTTPDEALQLYKSAVERGSEAAKADLARVEVVRIEGEIASQEGLAHKLEGQAKAAAANTAACALAPSLLPIWQIGRAHV